MSATVSRLIKLEAEVAQLQAENKWLREAKSSEAKMNSKLKDEILALRAQLAEARAALEAARSTLPAAERQRDEFERHRYRDEPKHPPSDDGFINDYD